jgi:lipopolysaccharide transport system permease protein
VHHTMPFLVQIWLFATPVGYPAGVIDEPWQTILGLNPMAGVVEGFRWALLGHGGPPDSLVFVSAAVTLVVLFGGLLYFRRTESTFADVA